MENSPRKEGFTQKTIADRLKYGSGWNSLDHDAEDRILKTLCRQADTDHWRKNVHSMVAEWINQNYILDVEVERYDPEEDTYHLHTVQAKVKTTQHGHNVFLDIPRERSAIAKKSYAADPSLNRTIETALGEFADKNYLFTRGVLEEIETSGDIDPNRLEGLDEYVYERVGSDFGGRYLRVLDDRISGLVKVERE